MDILKAQEILELNLKEAGSKMPPDTREALRIGVLGLNFISNTCPTPFQLAIDRQEVIFDAKIPQ